jgi:Short C-terminal domain
MTEPTEAVESSAEPALTRPPPTPHSRRWLIDAILACAVVVGVFAALAVWVNRQLLDTNSWTNTSSQLLADPKIQSAVGGVLVNELFSSVNISADIKSVLPSQVAELAAPATAGLRALAIQVAPQVLSTATVQNAWRQANRTAQLELLRILNGGSKTVSTNEGVVALQLHPLLTQLAAQLGLQEQVASVQSRLQGASTTAARKAVRQTLGVTLPPLSGRIVILRSSQLKTAQNIVVAIKGFALLLPLIAFGLFLLAVWLAEGWRRVALRATGWCLIAIGVIVVLARRIIGDAVVNSLVKLPSNKPAVHQAFSIGTSLLYDAAIALITYGAAIVIAAWILGPTRPARALRRVLAPSLREHPTYVYAAAGLGLLLVVVWRPFASTGRPIPVIGIAVLAALGIRTLRQRTVREFPAARGGDTVRAIRTWSSERRHSVLSAISPARASVAGDGEGHARVADLERLADLYHRGDLTDEEFSAHKATLLSRHS